MLNFSIGSVRAFILIYICTFMFGCGIFTWYAGKTIPQVHKEIDTNKDGKLSKEEIKASAHDLNKDGEISVEEMEAATAGSDAPENILMILAGLNVPFALVIKNVLGKLKGSKENLYAVAGGIEDLVALKQDGITKADIYAAIKLSAKHRGNVKALHKVVKEIKTEIREAQSHIRPLVVNPPT